MAIKVCKNHIELTHNRYNTIFKQKCESLNGVFYEDDFDHLYHFDHKVVRNDQVEIAPKIEQISKIDKLFDSQEIYLEITARKEMTHEYYITFFGYRIVRSKDEEKGGYYTLDNDAGLTMGTNRLLSGSMQGDILNAYVSEGSKFFISIPSKLLEEYLSTEQGNWKIKIIKDPENFMRLHYKSISYDNYINADNYISSDNYISFDNCIRCK